MLGRDTAYTTDSDLDLPRSTVLQVHSFLQESETEKESDGRSVTEKAKRVGKQKELKT